MDSIGTQNAAPMFIQHQFKNPMAFLAIVGDNMTIQIQEQEVETRKISLERMKTRSREFRENGEKPIRRSGITRGMRSLILGAADGRPCPTCETPMRFRRTTSGIESPDNVTIEHILPIKEGGANEPENLIAMCLACNRARGYAYNQASKVTTEEVDDVLEWLWFQINRQRLAHVVELQLAIMYPNHHAIFERNWVKQYTRA